MSSGDEDLTMETHDTEGEEHAELEGKNDGEETPAKRPAVAAGRVEHFTVAERTARGKAARSEVPRASHGDWEPNPQRPDPVELLEEQGTTRVKELVPIRYGRMLVSPFTFYRGAAYLMASDLASGPRTGLHTQLCGDAHLSNFGGYAAPDRAMVFSLNDFDETLPGPFEWDVKRLVASFAVAGRDRGFDEKEREAINLEVGRSYRENIRKFASAGNLDLWYARINVADIVDELRRQANTKDAKATVKRLEQNVSKARTKDSMKAFSKLTTIVDGEPRITGDPPLIVPIEDVAGDQAYRLEEFLRNVIRSYRRTLAGDRRKLLERFRYADAARKVVGVGSVGTRAFICLMLGRDGDDPLFLQFKEAQASVLEPFLGRSEFASHGQRVVEGQRLTQAASDIMLGWIKTEGVDGVKRDFYIRQLWDSKMSVEVETMLPRALGVYARLCGSELARAHARAGDGVAIASYLGAGDTFDRAMARFAEVYADQNERDYAALKTAVEVGRVSAEFGL